MTRNVRKFVVLPALVALSAAAVVAPTTASAAKKTYKVKMVNCGSTCGQVGPGTKITSEYTGKPFGHCFMKGNLVLPDTTQRWKCKGGSFTVKTHGTTGAADRNEGPFTISKGTGKFKGIKGKGKFSGLISTAKFTYTGTVRF